MAVAVALIRGFARGTSGSLGNFWVDLTRGTLRILLPLAFVAAILLIAGGVVQSFTDITMNTLAGHGQVLTGGPVASQEAIKELGNNGGGFFNANSAHPFENPSGLHQPARDLPDAPAHPDQPHPDPGHDAGQPAPGSAPCWARWSCCGRLPGRRDGGRGGGARRLPPRRQVRRWRARRHASASGRAPCSPWPPREPPRSGQRRHDSLTPAGGGMSW